MKIEFIIETTRYESTPKQTAFYATENVGTGMLMIRRRISKAEFKAAQAKYEQANEVSKDAETNNRRPEAYIDRVFRGYGEKEFGKDRMDTVAPSEVEEARCKAMRSLGVLTETFGRQPKGTAERLFNAFIACLLTEKEGK